ncbi:MAG: cadherin domain-containing protein [Prevotella sp.]|nr:cadherin domain-containing protein [Prevotella sp.]
MKRHSFVMQPGLALRALAVIIVMLTATTARAQATDDNATPMVSDQTFSKPEKQPDGSDWYGKTIGMVTTNAGVVPVGSYLTYKVTTAGVPFVFKYGTNELIVTDGSRLDFETKPIWTFNASVSDGELTQDFTVTVKLMDVNEAPVIPIIKSEYTIPENSNTGTVLGTFTVKDCDVVGGKAEQLTYALTGSLTGAAGVSTELKGKTLADIFYLQETANANGERTVAIAVKNESLLDYEKLYISSKGDATFTATVTVTDTDNHSVSANTKITVQDVNEDLTATGGTFYIQEHSPGLSHVCTTKYNDYPDEAYYGKVAGSDKDKYNKSFGTLTYSMSTRNTGTKLTDSKSFVVDPDDGSIFTAANAEFEYDGDAAKKSYTFLVGVSDGEFSKDVEVTVNVLDITEPPINLVTEGSGRIREDATKGTSAATFDKKYITDENELAKFEAMGDDVRFTINGDASGYGVFKAVETTGEIKLEDPTKIDFETLCAKDASCKRCETFPMYEVEMTASNADATKTLTITRYIEIIDVNEPPTASNFTETVDENIAGGTVIGTIEASDPDTHASCNVGSHSCGFNTLHYSIVDASGLPFEIEEATGKIQLKKNERLRYSEKRQYQFDVKVSDRATSDPALSTFAHVTINVIDDNEPSEFVTLGDVFEVEENVEAGTKLEGDAIVVVDDDQADANNLKITITDNDATDARDAADLFEVVQVGTTDANTHKSTFAIQTKADLDYESLFVTSEKDAVFNVTLTITDKAANTISQETRIRVIPVNEKPAFTKKSYAFEIRENTKNATSLGKAEAADPDIYTREHNNLHYSLEGDDAEPFMINYSTGEIYTINGVGLDYETKNSYSFQAVVTDGKLTDKASVTVTVKNMNELPEFPEMSQPLTVVECALQGATVGVVEATDDDLKNGNQGNKPTYSLEATDAYNDYKKFRIDKNSGTITVAANPLPAYVTQQTYRVRVVATDGSDPTFTSEVDVTIKVLPYLDNLFDGDNAWTNYVAPENMAVVDGSSGKVVTDGDMGAFLPSRYTFGSSEVELTQLQGAPKGKPVILGRPTDVSGNPIKSSSYLTIVPDASDDPTEVTGETIDADYDAAVEAMDKQHFAITDGTKKLQAVIEGTGNSTSDATVMVLKGGRFKSVYISNNDLSQYAKDGLLLFILSKWEYMNVGTSSGTTNAARSIGIGDGGATAIENYEFRIPNSAGAWYDLQGRRIEKPTRKGLYIRNGVKVVVM